jgi:murein DD-endopeptidase MepM/ murein hydrolase activator NlpD
MRNQIVPNPRLNASIRVLTVFAVASILAGCSGTSDRFMSWRKNASDSDPVYTAALPKKKPAAQATADDQDQIASRPIKTPKWKLNGASDDTEGSYATLRRKRTLLGSDAPTEESSARVEREQVRETAANEDTPSLKASRGKIRVERGMTLYSIASANDISIKQLASANRIRAPYRIREGQILQMPSNVTRVRVPTPTMQSQKQQLDNDSYANNRPRVKPLVDAQEIEVVENNNNKPTEPLIDKRPSNNVLASSDSGAGGVEIDSVPPIPKSGVNEGNQSQTDLDLSSEFANLRWPVKGKVIVDFGKKSDGSKNEGINIAVPEGTMIKAATDGVVAYAGNELKGYGNLVLIRHDGGYVTAYAHAKELNVRKGDQVKRGDIIGLAGQTGAVSSPQLHFEVRKGPTALNPLKFLGNATAQN